MVENRNKYFILAEFTLLFVYIIFCIINLIRGREIFSFNLLLFLLGVFLLIKGVECFIYKDKNYLVSLLSLAATISFLLTIFF